MYGNVQVLKFEGMLTLPICASCSAGPAAAVGLGAVACICCARGDLVSSQVYPLAAKLHMYLVMVCRSCCKCCERTLIS